VQGSGNNDSVITVIVDETGSVSDGPQDAIVTSNTGSVVTLDEAYLPNQLEANITAVSPSSGQVGTVIEIEGRALLGGGNAVESVTLNGAEVLRIYPGANDSHIVVSAGNGTGAGAIVITSDTGAIARLNNAWEYTSIGLITAISPQRGTRGTRVVISGQNLLGAGSSIISVTLASVEVGTIVDFNSTAVTVIAAGSGPGRGDIIITSDTGAIISTSQGCE